MDSLSSLSDASLESLLEDFEFGSDSMLLSGIGSTADPLLATTRKRAPRGRKVSGVEERAVVPVEEKPSCSCSPAPNFDRRWGRDQSGRDSDSGSVVHASDMSELDQLLFAEEEESQNSDAESGLWPFSFGSMFIRDRGSVAKSREKHSLFADLVDEPCEESELEDLDVTTNEDEDEDEDPAKPQIALTISNLNDASISTIRPKLGPRRLDQQEHIVFVADADASARRQRRRSVPLFVPSVVVQDVSKEKIPESDENEDLNCSLAVSRTVGTIQEMKAQLSRLIGVVRRQNEIIAEQKKTIQRYEERDNAPSRSSARRFSTPVLKRSLSENVTGSMATVVLRRPLIACSLTQKLSDFVTQNQKNLDELGFEIRDSSSSGTDCDFKEVRISRHRFSVTLRNDEIVVLLKHNSKKKKYVRLKDLFDIIVEKRKRRAPRVV